MLISITNNDESVNYEGKVKICSMYQNIIDSFKSIDIFTHEDEETHGITITAIDEEGITSIISFKSSSPRNKELGEDELNTLDSIYGYMSDNHPQYVTIVPYIIREEDYKIYGKFTEIPEVNTSNDYTLSISLCRLEKNEKLEGYLVLFLNNYGDLMGYVQELEIMC